MIKSVYNLSNVFINLINFKIMQKIIIILLLIPVLSLISCKTEYQKQALIQIDEMLINIEKLEAELNKEKVLNYQRLYDTIKKYNNFFLFLPEDFDNTEKNLEIAYHYGEAEKTFKKLYSHYLAPYRQNLILCKNQLEALKEDVNNRFFRDEEIKQYLHSEDSALNSLEVMIYGKLEYAKENYEKYQIYHPKVKELVKEYDFEL